MDRSTIDEQLKALGESVYNTYKNGKVLDHLPSILHPDENILAVCAGTIVKRGWLFVLTEQRLLMLSKGFFTKFKYDQLLIEHIDGVAHTPGLMLDKVQLNVRGKAVVLQILIKEDAPRLTGALIDLLRKSAEQEENAQEQDDASDEPEQGS